MQITFLKTGDFWQWDRNRRIRCIGMESPADWQVHVSAPDDDMGAYVLLPYRDTDGAVYADIPNILLQTPHELTVYAYHVASAEKQTKSRYSVRVRRREMPADYVYTETEVWDWQAIADAENARTAAEQERVAAETARSQAEQDRTEAMHLIVAAAANAVADADLAAANAREAAANVRDGNVLYATFDIDLDSGALIMTTPEGYGKTSFEINENGELEVNVHG